MAAPTQTIRLPTPPVPSSSRPPRPPRPPRPQPAPYIPPFRAKRLPTVASPKQLQLQHWTGLKKAINGIVNRLNASNLPSCVIQLLRLNIVRARGLFCKAVLRAQLASPNLSPVFASFVAVIGSRFPAIVNLLVRRLVAQLRAAYGNQDRISCFATARFLANLCNQYVVKEILVLEFLLTWALEPSDGSAELAVVTLRECVSTLYQESPPALELVFDKLRAMLHDGQLGRRAEVAIDNLLDLRRKKFRGLPSPDPRLDLLHDKDIFTHDITLEEDLGDLQHECDKFQFDPNFEQNENAYESIKKDILGAAMDNLPQGLSEDPNRPQSDKSSKPTIQAENTAAGSLNKDPMPSKTTDMTEAELQQFRRTVYLIHSSTLSHEESAHRLLILMRDNKGREHDLCQMLIECCSQEKTFLRVYGLLSDRLCRRDRVYHTHFEDLFATHYATIHRFETRRIRNIANLFAFLLAADSISWSVLEVVRIVEEETTASSRAFLKFLMQELCRSLGEAGARERFKKAERDGNLTGVFPTDNVTNAKFSINLLTTIGLGYLTEGLREKLKDLPKKANDDDAENTSSSSFDSDSASSSSLSIDSGEEVAQVGISNDNESRGSKRPQDPASRAESERPTKSRRIDDPSIRRDRFDSQRRRDARRNMPFDDIERNHRAYVNSPSGSRTRRYAPEHSDEDRARYRSKRHRSRYGSYHDDRRSRDVYRSSRPPSRDHRDRYWSDDDAPRRASSRDRNEGRPSDMEDFERNRHGGDEREASPHYEYDDDDRDISPHRNKRRSSDYHPEDSQDSRERQRRHRSRRYRHYSDSESNSYSPDRRRRRGSSWHRRRSNRRHESSDYSDAPSASRSPRHRRRR
ncbi:Pre-mRNA-splicing factor CWC22 [Gracilariopsis chorda]|uniref:Pre-mRNA-splicing factor CWC22 n=1 Tax=Gracilariopsis chorda TaxID=448386 RepID=A0A2V3J259_9FLOR|nr:Pre-mRNA-splicing factor CWC22 [Gracilariopsis chorda]|eukprot:PXF48478.1 Pre-mRNA-splicing factor CWC22 [Gracilariopsis chorda]